MYPVLKSSSERAINDRYPLYLKVLQKPAPIRENDNDGDWFESLENCKIRNILD